MMDVREKQLIEELIEALANEWIDNHQKSCGYLPMNESHDCLHPKPKQLLKWEDDRPRCAYCGAVRDSRKPWKIYCSQKCNSAAYRKRKKAEKEALAV